MSEFAEYLHEAFERFGPIAVRRMFGGYGVFHDGLMFGLVAGDTLYLKADSENAHTFEELGLGPFEYGKNGKVMTMSYFQAPDDILDDRDAAAEWAARSFEAALRAQRGKKKRRRQG